MPARRCPTCKRPWPPSPQYTLCPVCRGTTIEADVFQMSAQECDHTLALLASLDAELLDAELEARRRGPHWSIVDCLVEHMEAW